MKKYDTIILGAGITGLFIGYKLSKKGKKVLIIEKSKEIGGLLGSIETNGYPVEKYYHHVFINDKNFLELVDELKINKFKWYESTLGFYNNKKIHDLSMGINFIFYKPLNLIDKFLLSRLILSIKMPKDMNKLDKVTAEKWIIKYSSPNVYKKFFKPLLRSKYGDNINKVSAAWFIKRIRERSTGGLGKEKLGYIRGGFDILIKRLESEILRNGGKILKNSKTSNLLVKNGKIDGVKLNGKSIKSNYVISTIPLPELSKFKELSSNFRKSLDSIKYQGATCVTIGMKKKLTDYYWTNITDNSKIGAIIEHTNLLPLKDYKDHIIYLASYPDKNSKVWGLSDKKVFDIYFNELKILFPELNRSDIVWWKISRNKNAGLVYETGYQKKRIGHKTPIDNFYTAGMFNCYPERPIEYCLVAGKEVLKLMN